MPYCYPEIDIKKLQEVIKTPFVDLYKLKNALNFWRGPFLDGLSFYSLPPFDEWLLRERQQSHLFFRDGWMLLSKRLVMKEKKQEALEAALYLINLDPLFEPAHRHFFDPEGLASECAHHVAFLPSKAPRLIDL